MSEAAARLRQMYELETRLATRLRQSARGERTQLYGALYNEFYTAFPEVHRENEALAHAIVGYETDFARRFLTSTSVVAEVGPGRCQLAFSLAAHAGKVYGVDVSEIVTGAVAKPANFELVLSDGVNIPLPNDSVDLVVSNQMMEHLHPDDAADQLHEVHRILRAGGHYICITPNRLNGPHDVSRDFDTVARGFHLKEYTTGEIVRLFRATGFGTVQAYVGARGSYVAAPAALIGGIEAMLVLLPAQWRKREPLTKLLRVAIGTRVVATK